MTRPQFAWLIFCLLTVLVSLAFALIYRAVTGSQEPLPLAGMACFFAAGGFAGLLVGGSDK